MNLRIPLFGCVSLLAFVLVGGAVAQNPLPSPDPIADLRAALHAEQDAKKDQTKESAGESRFADKESSFGYLEPLEQALARGDDESALQALMLIRRLFSSEPALKACDNLTARITRERADKEAALDARIDDLTRRSREAVLKAKEPKDLDAVLQEFGGIPPQRVNRFTGEQVATSQRVQATIMFLDSWQDYLFALNRGDDAAVVSSLRNLAQNNNSYNQPPLIPRSEILARIPEGHSLNGESRPGRERTSPADLDAAAASALEQTHTLDDIPAAIGKLTELRSRDSSGYTNNNSDFGLALTSLQNLQKTRLELQSGLATTVTLGQSRSDVGNQRPGIESKLVPLRAELIMLALPRLLNAPAEKPASGEGVNAFLRRLIEAAKARGDWASVVQGLEIGRTLVSSNTNSTANNQEVDAFKQFFSGLNLEEAGQFQQAVIAYLVALKTGVHDLPATTIGEHLAAIKKAHPAEFEAGSAYSLNPPAPQYPPGMPYGAYNPAMRGMYDPRYDPRINRSGFPGAPEPQATPPQSLTVPAVPGPTPAPSKPSENATPAAKPTAPGTTP